MNIKELLIEEGNICAENMDIRILTKFERLTIILKCKELEILQRINSIHFEAMRHILTDGESIRASLSKGVPTPINPLRDEIKNILGDCPEIEDQEKTYRESIK